MKARIRKCISSSVENYHHILDDKELQKNIEELTLLSVKALKNDKKMLFCGNGGSASDAQHIASELSGRFIRIALHFMLKHCMLIHLILQLFLMTLVMKKLMQE